MKNNFNKVGTPEIIISDNDLIRVPQIIACVVAWRKSGLSARAFTRQFNKEESQKPPEERQFKKPLHHQTLSGWGKRFKGNMKALCRARRKKAVVENSLILPFPSGRDQQFDFILNYVGSSRIDKKDLGSKYVEELLDGSKSISLAKAHRMMVDVTPFQKWGSPMTIHMLYHWWESLDPSYRAILLKSKNEAYEEIMVYLPKPKGLANDEWQTDELQFNVKGINPETGKDTIVTVYCVTCVDKATGFLRHIEVSQCPIDKMAFLRALKRSLIGNRKMGVPGCARPVILRMDGASIHEKKASKIEAKNDLRRAALAVDFALLHNKPYSKRENPNVENINGNFKRDVVLNFIMFVKEIAPAMNTEEWVTHLLALQEQIEAFGRRWNTTPQKDGTSRLQKVMDSATPESLDITEEQIDRGIRYTLSRSFWEHVTIENEIYYNPSLLSKQVRRILVRVRPDGPGEDVEAYSRGVHIGTLHRLGDKSKMAEGMNSACKALITRTRAEIHKRQQRFKDMFEQLAIDGAPIVTPMQREILLRKRGLGTTSETPMETTKSDAAANATPPESTDIGSGWTGGKL